MIKVVKAALLGAGLLGMSACSTIVSGTDQEMTVATEPSGATCDLYREGQQIASIASTPGTVTVDRTKHDITIKCNKAGYPEATYVNESEVEGATFGNILAGGVIGWAVDSSTGADNYYEEEVTINLAP